MNSDPSVRQLYSVWAGLLLLGAALAYFVVGHVGRNGGSDVWLLVAAVTLGVVVFGYTATSTMRQIGRLLREPTSAPMIERFQRMPRTMPHRDAIVAHSCALTATLYGEFERAEMFLGSVEWDGRGRVYEAMPLQVRALIHYWRDRDYARGLIVARDALELGGLDAPLPGAGIARLAYRVLVATGSVLTGASNADDVETLRRGVKRLPILAKVIAMWGLAASHERAGEHAEAEALLSELRRAAPHCTPLHSVAD